MKKRVWLTVILMGILVLTVGCGKAKEPTNLEITRTINAGIPYEWEFEIEDTDVAEFVKSYVVEDKNQDGLVGAPVTTKYVFKGLKEGKTTITFKMISITDDSIESTDVYKIEVDKDKNVKLVTDSE